MSSNALFHFFRPRSVSRVMWILILAATCGAGKCVGQDASGPVTPPPTGKVTESVDDAPPATPPQAEGTTNADPSSELAEDSEPCITGPPPDEPCVDPEKIPRFVENSPFENDGHSLQLKRERRMWASSFLWAKAPDFVVEKWLTDEPEMKGKYVLIEFWATWCGPCRRSIPLLNEFHRKYGDELVVIGICEEDEAATRTLNERHPQVPPILFYSAIDTQKRMKDQLGVWGIPHVILLEPDGYVIWEGFPLQKGYELTDTIIERILAVGRKLRAKEKSEGETAP
jgi:cytochrome c biogenesis protein CcmG/thiol:disulfide interchange protein DsbE